MKNYTYLSIILAALTTSFAHSMQQTVSTTTVETHGIQWKKDNFGNILLTVSNLDTAELDEKLSNFVTELKEKEKEKALIVQLPHAEGQKAAALVKARFMPHYTDASKTEWVYKNGSPMPEASTAAAGARVMVCRDDYVLVIEDKGMKGRLMFPGGSVDPRELALDAACRELKEEVGLTVLATDMHKIALVNRVRANRYGYSDYCHYYATSKFTGNVTIQESEIAQAFWAPLADIMKGEPINNLKISPTAKLLAAHVFDNCNSGNIKIQRIKTARMLDPRQYTVNADQQDKNDCMDIDLFPFNWQSKDSHNVKSNL